MRPSKPPPLLMAQLKRFTFDLATLRRRKLNHRVSSPIALLGLALTPTPTLTLTLTRTTR